jgi:hypothetical protein
MRRPRFTIATLFALTTVVALCMLVWQKSQPPNAAAWEHAAGDFDAAYARKMFFGKTRREGELMFAENSLSRQEDLLSMPAKCLNFYLHSYMDYLTSASAQDDPDGASCFISLVKSRATEIRSGKPNVMSRVTAILDHLASRQDWYDADPSIYGDFKEQAEDARLALEDN